MNLGSPAAARAHGIETVYQDLALFDNLGAGGELLRRPRAAGPRWLPRGLRSCAGGRWPKPRPRCSSASRSRCRPARRCRPDVGGQRQAIAVARAAAFASQVVILDEPTAALGVRESRRVLDLIRRLRDEGRAVIVISHAMDHVIEIADRAVVLRRGRKVGEEFVRRRTT